METLVFEVLIAFGVAVATEIGFQLADVFERRQRRRQAGATDRTGTAGSGVGLAT